jgi:hypothetical protein
MMEKWNVGPPWRDSVLSASSGIIAWIIVKKWTRYEFGLGQGILGMKSGKRSILQQRLYQHFMMIPIRHPFSALAPENTPLLRENQYNYMRLDTLSPPFHYPLRAVGSTSRRPEPKIPLFQNSNIPIGAKPLT